MSNLFYRDLKHPPLLAAESANEVILGKGYKDDLSAGAGITCLGHSNEAIKCAMEDQIQYMPYCHAMNWTNQPAEDLATKLIHLVCRTQGNSLSKFHDGRVIFLNTGAEAVETACKVAAQYCYELDQKPVYFGRKYSYHGNTFFTLALGDHPKKHLYPLHKQFQVRRFPSTLESNGLSALQLNINADLEQNELPIVVVEPVGGTTIGIEPPPLSYLAQLQGIVDEAGGLLIYDEVLCGNYRTGELFAYQFYGAPEPDIICLGKGLTGGYFPLSAVIVSRDIVAWIEENSGKLWHSTTNQNHPIGCAAGLAALGQYEEIKDRLPVFGDALQAMAACRFTNVTGVGSLLGIRLDPEMPGLHAAVRREALNEGIVVYTDGGTIDTQGNMILLAPPYSYMQDMLHLEESIQKLARVVNTVMAHA